MSFIQIIEYETDRPDEMWALGDSQIAQLGEAPKGFRLSVAQDRDKPGSFVTIVEFPSYEAAMANSELPETGEFAGKMAALCSGAPRFRNLEVKRSFPA